MKDSHRKMDAAIINAASDGFITVHGYSMNRLYKKDVKLLEQYYSECLRKKQVECILVYLRASATFMYDVTTAGYLDFDDDSVTEIKWILYGIWDYLGPKFKNSTEYLYCGAGRSSGTFERIPLDSARDFALYAAKAIQSRYEKSVKIQRMHLSNNERLLYSTGDKSSLFA